MKQLDGLFNGTRPVRLDANALPFAVRVVVLAPHPDDFDAIGVSMQYLHNQGHEIHVAVMTSGASGVDDGWNGAHTPHDKAALREAEQRASCAFFGLSPDRLTFMRLWESDDELTHRERLRAYLDAKQPQLVFMPHGNDTNATHRRVYESFRSIAEQDRMAVWAVLNRDAKTLSMRTDAYMSFDEATAQWKAELLRMHRSQHVRNLKTRNQGFDERVLQMNRDSANQCGSDQAYAEVFELQRFGS